jgi:hypothetical protein
MIAELVRHLTAQGVRFQVSQDKVIVTAPKHAVTQETKTLLAAHKAELLLLLRAASPTDVADALLASSVSPAALCQAQEIEYWKQTFDAHEAELHRHPAPAVVRRQNVVFNGRQVAMTFARHNCSGTNRFGQDAHAFPFCVIHVERWREHPFDLSCLPWYHSPEHAAEPPRETASEVPKLAGSRYAAKCGGTPVVLQQKAERWSLYAGGTSARCRRRDFASPFVEHAMRQAEAWYSPPTEPWREEAT